MKLQVSTKAQAGTSLTEVVAAVAIMAICAAGLMASLANGFRTMQLARENQRATQILMEQAEMIRLYSWDQINRAGVVPTNFTASYDPQSVNGGGLTYNCKVKIENIPSSVFSTSYSTNMRKVTLILNWTSKSISRNRTNYTLVARDGYQNYAY